MSKRDALQQDIARIGDRDSLVQRYGPISIPPAIAFGLSAMGHIGNGHVIRMQQVHQATAVSQDSTLGLASSGLPKDVLTVFLPPFNPTLGDWSDTNTYNGANVTAAIVFTGIGQSGLCPLGT